MRVIDAFDPSVAQSGNIDVGIVNPGAKVLLYNLSLVTIKLNFNNGSTALLHAGEANFWVLDGITPTIQWSQYDMLNAASPPISKVTGTVYEAKEPVNGVYPMALQYQTNIANPGGVNTNVNATQSIVNDGNAPGTSIIEATPSDASASTWQADNKGNLTVKSDDAGVLTTLIQLIAGASPTVKLAAAALITEVLGDLKVDGTSFLGATQVFGTLSMQAGTQIASASGPVQIANGGLQSVDGTFYGPDGSNTIIAATGTGASAITRLQSTNSLALQVPPGATRWSLGSDGLLTCINNGGLKLLTGGLLRTSTFTGTGSGTVNHGLSAIPDICLFSATGTNSATFGFTNANATTVQVTVGATVPWKGTALRFT